jgi:predicted dinucleotide-binding enzyme
MAKKTIAIIGATGKIGTAIAKGLAKSNCRLLLFADDRKNLNSLAKEIRTINPLADIDCMGCAADASWEADIIIPAVPSCSQKDIAQKIKPYANRKIVISIPDSLNETENNLVTSTETDSVEELQTLLPGAKVVTAFTFLRSDFSQPVIEGNQENAFFASDDEEALEAIAEILKMVALIPNN